MRQKWGQNFLADRGVAERIVKALGAGPESEVLEIGPGRGILTQFLAGKVRRLVAVEIDRELCEFLRVKWAGVEGFEVVHQDFLEWPLPRWPKGGARVIGNLPYSSAGFILRKLLDWPAWETMVVTVQKEVADRMAAPPGNKTYGVLSLAVQSKARAERLFDVAPGCFRPVPEVTSAVVRLVRLPHPMVADEEAFFRVVRAAFGQRRKTLLNALAGGLEMEKSVLLPRLQEAGIDPTRRAETLSLEEFSRLSGALSVKRS